MSDSEFVYKSQDVNYLGFLEAQLRDMVGVETLSYELIQNADDVQNEDGRSPVTFLSFDVTDEALIVQNNGRFRPVDFERLQNIAGGGKREESGVTGAFGLGFLAVYQITDAPEIFSSGRHWIIRPDAPTEQRIAERKTEASDTHFRLPWAFDPASPVRRTLRLEAVRPEQLDTFARQMGRAIAQAAIFLQRLEQLEVKRNGVVVRRIERQREGDRLLITDESGEITEWLLLSDDFADVAGRLRQEYPWQIEERRHSRIQIAIPVTNTLQAGRLYAVLPTADTMPLACYLNADFFPTTDRKRVHFDSGYQAAWNRAVVTASATLISENLAALRHNLTPTGLWHLLETAAESAKQAQQGQLPEVFATFWQTIGISLPKISLFYTVAGEWIQPAGGRLLPRSTAVSPEATIPVLHSLKLPILHPDLAIYAPLLHQTGTPFITTDDIAVALQRAGLNRPTPLHEAPSFLNTINAWQPLWTLLDVLLRGLPPAEREKALSALKSCAIVLTNQMVLRPLTQVYLEQPEALAIFPDVAWLHPALTAEGFPGRYTTLFGARQAVERLAEKPIDLLEEAWRFGRLDIPRLFHWFETQQIEIFADDPTLAGAIRQLPLCPVDGELRPLAHLFLPGGFEDPLQLAGLVDVHTIGGRRQFLQDLGVQELDFDTYLHTHLPRVLSQQQDLPADGRHHLLRLLAKRLGEFRDDEALRMLLSQLPLIPCLDGSFRPASSVYFSREVMELLGQRVHIGEPVESTAQQVLYEWLGVRTDPTSATLVQMLLSISQEWKREALDESTYRLVTNCWQALTERLLAEEIATDTLAELHGQRVIPNGRFVLTATDEMMAADIPELAKQFAEWAHFFLPADLPWLPAAMAAGVRPLSQAVTLAVVEGGEAVADTAVQEHIAARYPLLQRLLRAETAADHFVQTEILQKLKVMALPGLRIQAQLRLDSQIKVAEPESVSAKWINALLYLDSEKQGIPWTAVARELAKAIAPGRNVVGLALGIKEVLATDNIAEAAAVLDELGYP